MADTKHVLQVTDDGAANYTRGDRIIETVIPETESIRMERISDIRLSEQTKRFYIVWLKGPFSNDHYATNRAHCIAWHNQYASVYKIPGVDYVDGGNDPSYQGDREDFTGTLWFETYEAATGYEIWFVAQMRKAGVVF